MFDAPDASIRCVPRTTIDIDASVLHELKRRQRSEGKSLGRLVSELLAWALDATPAASDRAEPLAWTTAKMGARVDLEDKEALADARDER